jgi:hypothetical protein
MSRIFTRWMPVGASKCVGLVVHSLDSDLNYGFDVRVHLWWWRAALVVWICEKRGAVGRES